MKFINFNCNIGHLGPPGPSSSENDYDIIHTIHPNKNIDFGNSIFSSFDYGYRTFKKNIKFLIYDYFINFISSVTEILK
jgi:hypothetical protein